MNPKTLVRAQKKVVATVSVLLALAMSSMAADVTMTGSDGFGDHSFDTGLHWDSGQAPSAGNDYFTADFILRTPTTGTSFTFHGDSLTLSPGGRLFVKVGDSVTTMNVLTNMGRLVDAVGPQTAVTFAGNMVVPQGTNGGAFETEAGNQGSTTDTRWITNSMTLSGDGFLTNFSAVNSAVPPPPGYVIYNGDSSAFMGSLVVASNTFLMASSKSNLFGNPPTFNPTQLLLDDGGFLQPTASFALDNPNGGITIGAGGGGFDIASGLILTNAEALAGPGTLSLTNGGTLVQSGVATNFTGTLSVKGGTLVLPAGGSFAGPNTISIGSGATFDVTAAGVSLADGQTLAGDGTVTGVVTAGTGSKISPGGAGAAANLTLSALALTGGATLAYDFSATTNDVIAVSGDLSPSGTTSIQLVNVPVNNGTYTLMTVDGTLGGSASDFQVNALNTRTKNFSVSYDQTSTPKRVLLTVSGTGSAANLVWQGGVNNVWDIDATANWLNGTSSDVYYDADAVNFTDVGAGVQPTLDVTVNPSAVNFNSGSNYTLTGSGAIAGATAVSQGGTGTLTLFTTNTYSGGTIVTNGVLQVGNFGGTNPVARALGNPSGPLVSVSDKGTLNLNGAAFDTTYTAPVQISGTGASATQGAIDNTIGGLTSGSGDIGIGTLELTGDATVSASANWQIGYNGSGIVGNGYTLTDIGTNYLYLRHAAASPLGGLVISGGGVLFWDHADAVGSTATITLTQGGFIDTWNPLNYFAGLTFYNPLVVNGSGTIVSYRNPYNHPDADVYNGPVTLNGTLTFSNVSYVAANTYNNNQEQFGKITMNGNISGSGGVYVIGGLDNPVIVGSTIYGGNLVTLTGNNSYSGPTVVSNLVQLRITTANQSGGAYSVVDFGTLDVAVTAGKPTIPMRSLTLASVNQAGSGGTLGFTRLSGMPSSPVIYATNLTITSGVILPPLAGYETGQFPLIKYDGTIGGSGFAGLSLGALPAGVSASLVDNSGNHTIDLLVTAAGVQWTGANSSNWDLGTMNWFNPASSSATSYADGESVVFGNNATRYNVSIAQSIQPGGVTVNSTNDYVFSTASGGITGSGALIKNGSGTLTVACTNNTFTGGTYINGGTIKLADLNFAYPYGGGALNNNLGAVTIANGGTLDINGVQVPNYQSYGPEGYNVFVSGSGVGGNGALINSSTNDNDLADPGYVTLTGDATVGGPGDINIRMGVSPQLSSQSSDYTLTKVGAGQFRIRYVATVSTNFGTINILGGIVSYESSSPQGLGDPTKNILVGSGAGFAWGTAAAACVRPLICSNNSTIYGYNITTNVFNSPVTLVGGNVNLNANLYNGMIFSNVISGAGGVTVQYQSLVTFAAANTYSGDTTVVNCNASQGANNGSVLRLVGDGSINNSANITLQGITASQTNAGALDASGRVDGTFTLVSGQTLRGDDGSYVKGDVVADSGATITPGGPANIQYMTCSNNLTLSSSSTVAMDVSLDAGASNDLINVAGTAHYDGILQINNRGATALTNGASFKLFNSGSSAGDFASISGSPGPGLGWSFDPATGVAKVVTAAPSAPPISFLVSGDKLTLSWPAAQLGYTLQVQTNTLAQGLTTNWVDVSGSSSSTQKVVTIDHNAPTVFYRLRP